ncbi:MAG: hypothetical protein JSR57_09950 [Verrucomicrobia bacterium]|nr:hypothetical protein [Verrucomicrobiota bacterium]
MCAARTTPAFIPRGSEIPPSFQRTIEEFESFVEAIRTYLDNQECEELDHFFQFNSTPFRPLLEQKGTLEGILEELIGSPRDCDDSMRVLYLIQLMKDNLIGTRWATICHAIHLYQVGAPTDADELVRQMVDSDSLDQTARKKYITMLKEHVTIYTSNGNLTMLKEIQRVLDAYAQNAAKQAPSTTLPLGFNKA